MTRSRKLQLQNGLRAPPPNRILAARPVADEIQMTHRGMMIAIPEDEWVVFHDLSPVELADVLVGLARSVSLPKLRKHPRGPKKPKPKKQSGAKIKHVATAKLLKARQACTK